LTYQTSKQPKGIKLKAMTIQSAINKAAKANINVLFNETNHAYEFTQGRLTFFFMPNGKNEMQRPISCCGVTNNYTEQSFTKPNIRQAIDLFKKMLIEQ